MHALAQSEAWSSPSLVDPTELRSICSLFVTGVTIVTSLRGDKPVGVTVNSFTSVSLAPPLVLFCLHRRSGVRQAIQDSGYFTVNILAEDQDELSLAFARGDVARFGSVRFTPGAHNTPVLVDTLAHLCCRLVDQIDGGDHVIVLGEVTEVGVLREGGSPLTFFRSSHGRLSGADPVSSSRAVGRQSSQPSSLGSIGAADEQ